MPFRQNGIPGGILPTNFGYNTQSNKADSVIPPCAGNVIAGTVEACRAEKETSVIGQGSIRCDRLFSWFLSLVLVLEQPGTSIYPRSRFIYQSAITSKLPL